MNTITKLQKQIKAAQTKIDEIQEECKHPKSARTTTNGGHSGYDYERYWKSHHCGLCDLSWTEDIK